MLRTWETTVLPSDQVLGHSNNDPLWNAAVLDSLGFFEDYKGKVKLLVVDFSFVVSVVVRFAFLRKFEGADQIRQAIMLLFEKWDNVWKKKNKTTCIFKLLIVGPSCEQCSSDKGKGFPYSCHFVYVHVSARSFSCLITLSLFVCLCVLAMRVHLHMHGLCQHNNGISRVKARL